MRTISTLLVAAITLGWSEAFVINRDNSKRAVCDRDEALSVIGKPADEASSFCYSYMASTITYTTTVGVTVDVTKTITPVPWTVDATTTTTIEIPEWTGDAKSSPTTAVQLQKRDMRDDEPALATGKVTGSSATSSACGCLITVEPTVLTKTIYGTTTVNQITTLPAWTVTNVKTVTAFVVSSA